MEENVQTHNLFWSAIALFSAIPVLLILFLIDPAKAALWMFIILYVFLFIFCLGFFTIVFSLAHRQHAAAKREAVLAGILVVGLLILSSHGVLNWWITFIFAASLVLVEIFFLL